MQIYAENSFQTNVFPLLTILIVMEVNIPLYRHEKDSIEKGGDILCHVCLVVPFVPHSFVYGAYNTFTK